MREDKVLNKLKNIIKTKKIMLSISIVSLAIVIFAAFFYSNIQAKINRDVIYEGIVISGLDVGGLTLEDAKSVIEEHINNEVLDNSITGLYKEEEFLLKYRDIDYESNYEEVLRDAYNKFKNGSTWQRYNKIKQLIKDELHYTLNYKYNENKIDEFLTSIKNDFNIQAKNAIIHRKNNEFIIEEEVVGTELDIEKTKVNLIEALKDDKDKFEIVVNEIVPEYTKEYYSNIKDALGEYYTEFNPNAIGRTENLRLASSKINGSVIVPGEVYHTHDIISPITLDNGYNKAPIIISGKVEDGVGGGVCQVSSTLYNAVLYSELEVVERLNHSMPVTYTEMARDATMSGDYIDFKFKNSTDYPIYIESYLKGNRLYVTIHGFEERDPTRTIDFESVIVKRISPPPEKVIKDDTLAYGKRIVEKKAIYGYKTKLYKLIYKNGKFVEKELVNSSYYKPVGGEVRVGTKRIEKKETAKTIETINVDKDTEEVKKEDSSTNEQIKEGVTEDEVGESIGDNP